jgi:hypothetical protein
VFVCVSVCMFVCECGRVFMCVSLLVSGLIQL